MNNQNVLFQESYINLHELETTFDYLKISIASPLQMKKWAKRFLQHSTQSIGELTNPEMITFKTHNPQSGGLFCEQIFGPINTGTCRCGLYLNLSVFVKNQVCEQCNVEITNSRIRRYRMGYILLNCPILHIWYVQSSPNYLKLSLNILKPHLTPMEIDHLLFNISTVPSIPSLSSTILNDEQPNNLLSHQQISDVLFTMLETETGSNISYLMDIAPYYHVEVLKTILEGVDLSQIIKYLRFILDLLILPMQELHSTILVHQTLILKKLRMFENMLQKSIKPEWLILTILPVLPPALRPIKQFENGILLNSELNKIYQQIIEHNNTLIQCLLSHVPLLIIFNTIQELQTSINILIDNEHLSSPISINNTPLKSLTRILEGKMGFFRLNLLGKRVNFSGRSVIVVGPELSLNQCGLPYNVALALFEPFLQLQFTDFFLDLLTAHQLNVFNRDTLENDLIKYKKPLIWTFLKYFIKTQLIILNRAPTLHRFGIQTFEPLIHLSKVIKLHPLVCTGFNADFDGDQMAIHMPLSTLVRLTSLMVMTPSHNILSTATGELLLRPAQDMVIGCYYLTLMIKNQKQLLKKCFKTPHTLENLLTQKKITFQTSILMYKTWEQQKICFSLSPTYELCFPSAISDSFKLCFPFSIKLFIKFHIQAFQLHIFYLITNIGILIVKKSYFQNNHYYLLGILSETSPGRTLFSELIETSIVI